MFAAGYAIVYYGISKMIEYRPSESTTKLHSAVATLPMLLGVKGLGAQGGSLTVPFSLQTSSNTLQPAAGNTPPPAGGVKPV
jgi:hypothetical protein